ncbi:MAG: T9SS type A sorting domain-containing protein [Cyclobacteriaceae bacterium]
MKKYKLIVFFVMLLSSSAMAQKYTVHSFGYLGGQSNAVLGEQDSIIVNVSGGNVIATDKFHLLLQDKAQAMVGFPPMISYFPPVFDGDPFISKGYFSDYVQLKWSVISQQDRISRIKVYRKPLGFQGDSLLIATLAQDDFSYRDEYAEKGVLYKYTIYAEGIADDLRIGNVNFVEGVGFAFPFGTVAGRITYEGGTAVAGVQVLAETDGNLGGKSMYFNGDDAYLSMNHLVNDNELELNEGFSIQLWTQYSGTNKGTLFSKGSQYELAYESGNLTFTVAGSTLSMPYEHPVDSFFHVTAVYDAIEGLSLYVREDDYAVDSAKLGGIAVPQKVRDQVYFGRNSAEENYYQGYVDEIRLWNYALTFEEADANFSRYLSGSEDGLSGYWKLNSGNGNGFYDFSREGYEFHENHGRVWRAEWSEVIPRQGQLAYRGVTDEEGNYVVRGFPYETSGSQYTFTPIFGVHTFEPTQQLRFVGDGASIHNSVDFEDVSSFPVTGTIKYRHSTFPVEGVSVLIDGNAAINQEGEIIVSDNLGRFNVDVPIGFHSLKLSKNGHVFEGEGRFPPKMGDDEIPVYDYQQPLAGIEFIDSTVVKLVGKVVGGPIEAEKALGFGLSKNNIGNALIGITSEKGYDITSSDSTAVYNERDIVTHTDFTTKFVAVYPDEATGEFVTYLPPEKYVVTGVTAGDYVFGDEHKVSVNLETVFEQTESHEEVVAALLLNGDQLPGYSPYDSADYDYFKSEVILDTTYISAGKNFTFEKKKDFILRVKPDIEVVNQDGLDIFGEKTYKYEDELREDDITLIDESDNYAFGHPVFFQQSRYNMFISVFEEYSNADTGESDRVPVKDGNIEIVNDFGINTDAETLKLDDRGKVRYSFGAGFPELNKNFTDDNLSFTRTMALTALTGENGTIRTTWRESDPFRAIVFGGVPQGNNFVTTGPNQIITILRDPPGSGSYAFLEKGSTATSTVSWGSEISSASSVNAKLSLGPKVVTWAGVGAGVISEVEVKADVNLGLALNTSHTARGQSVNTITATKKWSTSGDVGFVNAPGDVFVGHSTNIVYGQAVSLQPVPSTDQECADDNCGTVLNGDFKLGPRTGLRLNPEFGTMFIYTQTHIENSLIPNLKDIRNSLLSYSSNPESVVADDEVIYLSLVSPEDERFGSANYNIPNWGESATVDIGVGPSYKILIPDGMDTDIVSDTIAYFNKQIEGWERVLEENERIKVQAQLSENISFDGGTSFSSSEKIESASSFSYDFNVGITASMGGSVGVKALGIGTEISMSQSLKMGSTSGEGSSVSNSTTYGYVLADGQKSGSTPDYYSIDVKTPEDGYGPVFVTRAGVTSCPFEGEDQTKYFEPGNHILNHATIQVEKPEITIVNPLVANVPSNRAAEILLELKNNSESETDVFYTLKVDDQSNFNGAILSIDGSVLTGDGRGILVPAGTTVSKILKVNKGSDDINDYEDIVLILSSQCDGKIKDSQSFSVYFQPGCSDISLVSPVDQWVLNTNTIPEKFQNVVFNNYDLQNSQFKYAKFQYKASSSSLWLTNMIFYNPLLVDQTEFDELDEPKAWIDVSGSTLYQWDMSDLPDRRYDVQVVSVCELGPGQTAETPTETHSGVKDTKRPVAFGAPQPADGILSANDEIMIQFDETIEAGLLTPFNFSVQGVLNSAEINHSTSVNFDGVNDYMKIADGLSLENRSFTIEFWIKRGDFGRNQIVYSKGYKASDVFEMGFNSSNNFYLNVGGQIITSANTFTDLGWNHYAVVYAKESNTISAYMNDEVVFDQELISNEFTGDGIIAIGKSEISNGRFLSGNIHELRIWAKARQLGDIYAKMSQTLTGSEVGLVGYWKMEEARGNKAFDLARFRHAILFADWEVSPKGQAYGFDGVDDYLELNSGSSIIVTGEMDFTIEFWFKGASQSNSVLFSSGKGDGTDEFNNPANSLSIGFDESGEIQFLNNGESMQVAGDYLDDDWHHFAFTLLRQSNANIFIDGEQKATSLSSNFGGLSGATMWLGARGYKISTVNSTRDQFFNGQIDDFRVWNLGKKSDQVNLNINSRLQGDEIGLIGYYPFEYYETVNGIKIMNSTLADQWENPFGPNGGEAVSFGGADFTQDAPNIKDARPVDKIDFDWAVNDDKIIITPSNSFTSLIEQTVLEITIQNVEDIYENRLASPVTWTAFVDRNQLKWGTEKIIAKKEVYEPFTFKVDVVNHGGTETNYSIDNLPLWLSASPSSGVMSPASTVTITFTVDEGLNTGYYLEDVYLSSDFGFDEKLTIDLQVTSPEPDWNTNPNDFQFSMNLIAQLEIADVISTDLNDRVAAFVNDTIRGDANIIYIETLDLYEVYLDIYSNVENGESIELRVWDADKGVEYRNALPNLTFESNTIVGTPSNPELIIAGEISVQKIDFKSGWNWSSINIESQSLQDINYLMRNVTAKSGNQIKSIDKFDVYTEGIGWAGTLTRNGGLETGAMYLFNLSQAGSIEVTGTTAASDKKIDINTGWNWLGFLPRFNMNINEAFAFFNPTNGDIIKSQFAFAVYDENIGWTGSLKNLEPSKGYLMKSAKADVFTYPESTFLGNRSGNSEPKDVVDYQLKEFDKYEHPYNMSLIAEIGSGDNSEYIVEAYAGENLRGVVEPTTMADGRTLYFMIIYGDASPDEITFKAIDIDTDSEYVLDQTTSFIPNNPLGRVAAPFLFTGIDQITAIEDKLDAVQIYPNPFTNSLKVLIPKTNSTAPEIVLTDLAGRILGEFDVKAANKGWSLEIDDSRVKLTPGIYLINIHQDDVVRSFRVIKEN